MCSRVRTCSFALLKATQSSRNGVRSLPRSTLRNSKYIAACKTPLICASLPLGKRVRFISSYTKARRRHLPPPPQPQMPDSLRLHLLRVASFSTLRLRSHPCNNDERQTLRDNFSTLIGQETDHVVGERKSNEPIGGLPRLIRLRKQNIRRLLVTQIKWLEVARFASACI